VKLAQLSLKNDKQAVGQNGSKGVQRTSGCFESVGNARKIIVRADLYQTLLRN
jgi:hypothetical protein